MQLNTSPSEENIVLLYLVTEKGYVACCMYSDFTDFLNITITVKYDVLLFIKTIHDCLKRFKKNHSHFRVGFKQLTGWYVMCRRAAGSNDCYNKGEEEGSQRGGAGSRSLPAEREKESNTDPNTPFFISASCCNFF